MSPFKSRRPASPDIDDQYPPGRFFGVFAGLAVLALIAVGILAWLVSAVLGLVGG